MRSGTVSKTVVILAEMLILDILAAQTNLDEELERLFEHRSLSDESLFKATEKIDPNNLDPMVANFIRYARLSPVIQNVGKLSYDRELIENMMNFHNFMLNHSVKYRNIDRSSEIIGSLISCHWNFIIKCLKEENNIQKEKLEEENWQFLARIMKKFWRITGVKGDIHFLDIASNINAGMRKIRDARKSPNDWAKMIRGMLIEKYRNDLRTSEEKIAITLRDVLMENINTDDDTGMKYPKSGYIAVLYDQLISEQCKTLQNDESLIISLKKAVRLAEATQWPKIGKEDLKIFVAKLDESVLEILSLGMVVCNKLLMDEHFRNEAIENGDAIAQALDDRIPSDAMIMDETELDKLLKASHSDRVAMAAKKVVKYVLEPEINYVIEYAQSFPIFWRGKSIDNCNNDKVEKAKKFHSFMMEHSGRYRNMDTDLRVIRIFIFSQWKYMIKCLNEENQTLNEHSEDYDTLMRMATKFLRITKIKGDLHFLDMASDLFSGRRKIRDASESPRDWAEIFKEMLLAEVFGTLFGGKNDDKRRPEEIFGNIYEIFESGVEEDASTKIRYPKEGYMGELYGLIMQQCETIKTDRKLVESINYAKKLAEVTHWPKTFKVDRDLFEHSLLEPVLGPLTFTSAVCNRLDNHYRDKVIDNGGLIVAAFTDMRQEYVGDVDEEHLEDLLTSGILRAYSMNNRAKKIPTAYLEPNLARIIDFTKFSPIFVEAPSCHTEQIEEMKNFHNLMLQTSKRYRKIDHNFLSIRTFIDGHWKYMLKCLDLEFKRLHEKFMDDRWQTLANIYSLFWSITSVHGDLYSLNIASDLWIGARKIRGADKNPKDWAKLIKAMLQNEMMEALDDHNRGEGSQELATIKVNNMLKNEIHFDAITGIKYSKEGYMGELYDRLIARQCKEFHDDPEIAKSLDYITNLGGVTQWPKKGRINGILLLTTFDDGMIGSLALGRVVCQQLDEHLREAFIDNEVAIFDLLTDGFSVVTPINISSMLDEDELIQQTCENSLTLVDVTGAAKKSSKGHRSTSMLFEQMIKLGSVASQAPDNFSCGGEEIETIHALSKSVSRIISVVMGTTLECFERLNALMVDIKRSFVEKCLRKMVAGLGRHADEETKSYVVKIPRFFLIIGQESELSLRDSLRYAGLLYTGRIKLLDPSKNVENWKKMLMDTGRALFRDSSIDIPDGLKKYWHHAQQQSLKEMDLADRTDGKFSLWLTTVYRKLTLGWCNIFSPDNMNVKSRYLEEVEKIVEIASSLLIWDNASEFFSNLGVKFEEEFLLKQYVLGYSVCNQLDPTIEFKYKMTAYNH